MSKQYIQHLISFSKSYNEPKKKNCKKLTFEEIFDRAVFEYVQMLTSTMLLLFRQS